MQFDALLDEVPDAGEVGVFEAWILRRPVGALGGWCCSSRRRGVRIAPKSSPDRCLSASPSPVSLSSRYLNTSHHPTYGPRLIFHRCLCRPPRQARWLLRPLGLSLIRQGCGGTAFPGVPRSPSHVSSTRASIKSSPPCKTSHDLPTSFLCSFAHLPSHNHHGGFVLLSVLSARRSPAASHHSRVDLA